MPARSTGCFTCRKRKIRCDGARPQCQRCAVHGVQCSGYAASGAGNIEFRDQTAWIVQRATKHSRVSTSSSDRSTNTTRTNTPELDSPIVLRAKGAGYDFNDLVKSMYSDDDHSPQWSVPEQENYFMANVVLTQNVPKASVMRSQLYAEFLGLYLPKNVSLDHYTLLLSLGSRHNTNIALVEAVDALSLVTIGSATNSNQFLKQSVSSYGNALSHLAVSLGKKNAYVDDELLATVAILTQCELFDEVRNAEKTGWISHVDGTQQLIAARGPENLTTDFSLTVLSNARHGTLSRALIQRKAPLIARPAWRKILREKVPLDDTTEFYDAALQIPGLLENCDSLSRDFPEALDKMDALLWKLDHIQQKLQNWFSDWQAAVIVLEGSVYCQLRPIDDFPFFTSLCRNRTFTSAFMFHNFHNAYLVSCYWQCMHTLRTAIKVLLMDRMALDHGWEPDANRMVHEEELLRYVLNLCQIIPYFCEPYCASSGQVGVFLPLRTIALYAKQHGRWPLLKWAGAVKSSVFVHGLSPPSPSSASIFGQATTLSAS